MQRACSRSTRRAQPRRRPGTPFRVRRLPSHQPTRLSLPPNPSPSPSLHPKSHQQPHLHRPQPPSSSTSQKTRLRTPPRHLSINPLSLSPREAIHLLRTNELMEGKCTRSSVTLPYSRRVSARSVSVYAPRIFYHPPGVPARLCSPSPALPCHSTHVLSPSSRLSWVVALASALMAFLMTRPHLYVSRDEPKDSATKAQSTRRPKLQCDTKHTNRPTHSPNTTQTHPRAHNLVPRPETNRPLSIGLSVCHTHLLAARRGASPWSAATACRHRCCGPCARTCPAGNATADPWRLDL